MRVEGDISIKRPIEEVFDYVADERNEPQYNPQTKKAEKITPGPIGAGTKFRSVMSGRGVTTEMTVEFIEFERPRRITERTHMSNMDITGGLSFEAEAEGTRLRWVWDLEPRGAYRFLGPVIRRIGDRQERAVWTGLKRVLEQAPVRSVGQATHQTSKDE